MSTTVNEIEIQTHASFSVKFEALSMSVINGALEQGYLKLLANPASLFIAPENMDALLEVVLAGTNYYGFDAQKPERVTHWINQTTGRAMDIVPLPSLDSHTIIFGFLEW
jgi:hypothetical protein